MVWETQMDITIASQHLYFTIFKMAPWIQYSRDAVTNPRRIKIITVGSKRTRLWIKNEIGTNLSVQILSHSDHKHPSTWIPTGSLSNAIVTCCRLAGRFESWWTSRSPKSVCRTHGFRTSCVGKWLVRTRSSSTWLLYATLTQPHQCSALLVIFFTLFRSKHNKMFHTSNRFI